MKNENVLVLPTTRVRALIGHERGVYTFPINVMVFLNDDRWHFMPRQQAETDDRFKQLIPYVVLAAGNYTKLFQYTRGKGGGEQRLHAKKSIGVGGHITSDDGKTPIEAYRNGIIRELSEELNLSEWFSLITEVSELLEPPQIHLIQDVDEVGQVHLGCLHVMNVSECDVSAREEELEFAGFKGLDVLRESRDSMEGWSQLAFDFLAAYL